MNVINKLELEGITIGIRYYGLEDLSTGISIKDLLDGKKCILNSYNKQNIVTIDDYINFVFLDYIMKFEETIPYVKEEKQEEFKEFIKKCKLIYKNYEIKNVIKYIQKDYKSIYSYSSDDKITGLSIDLKDYTSEFIADHFNCFSEDIMIYIINEATYNVIDCFEN